MVALVVLGVACSGSTEEKSVDTEVAELLPMTSESAFQRQILEDGEVSFREYETAVDRAVRCMDDAGLDASQELTADRLFQISVVHSASDGSQVDDRYSRCTAEFLTDVERTYSALRPIVPSSSEADLANCLVSAGALVEIPETRAELIVVLREGGEAVARCQKS